MNRTEFVLFMSLACQIFISFSTINYKRTPNEGKSSTFLEVSIYVEYYATLSGKYLPSF